MVGPMRGQCAGNARTKARPMAPSRPQPTAAKLAPGPITSGTKGKPGWSVSTGVEAHFAVAGSGDTTSTEPGIRSFAGSARQQSGKVSCFSSSRPSCASTT